jgi:hypothetical protein
MGQKVEQEVLAQQDFRYVKLNIIVSKVNSMVFTLRWMLS